MSNDHRTHSPFKVVVLEGGGRGFPAGSGLRISGKSYTLILAEPFRLGIQLKLFAAESSGV